MKICVCGSGNIACATAADLALMGHEVRLFELTRFENSIVPIKEAGGIELRGERTQSGKTGKAHLSLVTTNPEDAIRGVEVIFLCVPGVGHLPFVEALGPYVEESQVLFIPTDYWATLRAAKHLRSVDKLNSVVLAGGVASCYLAAKIGPTQAMISYLSPPGLAFSAFPSINTEKAWDKVKQLYPQYEKVPNVIAVNFQTAKMLAPLAGLVLDQSDDRTPASLAFKVVKGMYEERLKLGKVLDYEEPVPSQEEILMTDIPVTSPIPHTPAMVHLPVEVQKSVLREDLPYGYVPRIALAKLLGICTPVTEAVTTLLGLYLDFDPYEEGVDEEDLGIGWFYCTGDKEIREHWRKVTS